MRCDAESVLRCCAPTDMSGTSYTRRGTWRARRLEPPVTGTAPDPIPQEPTMRRPRLTDETRTRPVAKLTGRSTAAAAAALVLAGTALWSALPSYAASLPPTATGDARTVTEPRVPSTVCATLASTLSMSSRTASSSQETTPPDTARIQAALTGCTQSGTTPVAVKLVASGSNAAFLTGPLTVPAGVALLIDSPVTLFGSLNAVNYQVSGASTTCGTVASSSGGCKPLITVNGANAGIEGVRASSGTQGRIDGRGDLTLVGGSTTWWGLAATAKAQSLSQNNPRMIQTSHADNFTLYNVDLVNAPNFHVSYQNGTGFTAWGVRIKTPATAGNTDGIDPSGAKNVTIANSYIQDGDDGIAIKAGSVASSNITVRDSHFYGTHGISIGSETAAGATNILIQNNTVTGVDSAGLVGGSPIGLRIKSNSSTGGTVSTVSYLATCVTQVKQPLVFDTHYSSSTGSNTPFFTNILVNGMRSTSSRSGGSNVMSGYSATYPLGLTLENVSLDLTTTTAQYANVGLYNSNLTPSGTGVTTGSVSGSGSLPACTFPAYPAL
jgi:polygalacturonase